MVTIVWSLKSKSNYKSKCTLFIKTEMVLSTRSPNYKLKSLKYYSIQLWYVSKAIYPPQYG
jgi:hypothetical protein